MDKPTLSTSEAADWLGVHENRIYELIDDCVLPAGKEGRAYILLKVDVAEYAVKLIRQQTAQRLGGAPVKRRRKKKSPELVGQV